MECYIVVVLYKFVFTNKHNCLAWWGTSLIGCKIFQQHSIITFIVAVIDRDSRYRESRYQDWQFWAIPVPVPVKSHFSSWSRLIQDSWSRSRFRSRSITQICRDFDRDLLHNFIHCDLSFYFHSFLNFIFKHPLSQIKQCLKLLNKFE